ncbi:MAG TPA: SDR family NAD(P)-dependent oxidoreductase, partial [Cellvibrionaceae bacterium]|nr:SDR family NAD(P)-dependent oxidoreductase [Cellvibrionaceae bacterium]
MPTVVITGANRGIGLALAQEYSKQHWQVIALCRATSAELAATGAQVITGLDLKNLQGLAQIVQELKHQNVDVLINNAGILGREHLGDLDTA